MYKEMLNLYLDFNRQDANNYRNKDLYDDNACFVCNDH